MKTVLLIPAYNPERKIVPVVRQLAEKSLFEQIVIVNDGSREDRASVFTDLSNITTVRILEHKTNRGKGAALKTGFRYILDAVGDCRGVVTADADGQHSGKDIISVSGQLTPGRLTIGTRQFDRDTPFRSHFGNRVTRGIMRWFFKVDLRDTQSGLRAIPIGLLPSLLKIKFNRYEFEVEMLMIAKKEGYRFHETAIDTIYEQNNSSSSFNPLVDSAKIYFVLFRYILASIVTAAVDYIVFFTGYAFIPDILICTYLARLIALFVNFVILKQFVFHSKAKILGQGLKYLMIVIISGFISSIAIEHFNSHFGFSIVMSKISAELLLYFGIFIAQKEFVFKKERRHND